MKFVLHLYYKLMLASKKIGLAEASPICLLVFVLI